MNSTRSFLLPSQLYLSLRNAQVNVSVDVVEGKPHECGAKEPRKHNGDQQICRWHVDNEGKDGLNGEYQIKKTGRNCGVCLVLSAV
jgi:hypothetical protein